MASRLGITLAEKGLDDFCHHQFGNFCDSHDWQL